MRSNELTCERSDRSEERRQSEKQIDIREERSLEETLKRAGRQAAGESHQAKGKRYNFKEESVLQEFQKKAAHRGERERSERESVSKRRACGGCLGVVRRRRTQQAAKSLGELQASEDPGVSEWGNLIVGKGY